MSALLEKAAAGLRRGGFEVVELDTAQQVKEYLLEQIGTEKSVGAGGSMSVKQTDILPALRDRGCAVHTHWGAVTPEEAAQIRRRARDADVYLCSANAVSASGQLVLVDGVGNRVGAICDGPKEVYFIISVDKIVDGGLTAAIARVKRDAAPPNCKRLGMDTPCAHTGVCGGDACTDPSCRITIAVDFVPRGRQMTVIFVKEKLGF